MSCILRVAGTDFDVDSYLDQSELEPINVWYKGEPVRPKSSGKVRKLSGLSIELSPADFSEFEQQCEETLLFCQTHYDHLVELVSYQGVERATADFGVNIYPPGWCSFYFDPELLLIMGKIGITLGLSVYPTTKEKERRVIKSIASTYS